MTDLPLHLLFWGIAALALLGAAALAERKPS